MDGERNPDNQMMELKPRIIRHHNLRWREREKKNLSIYYDDKTINKTLNNKQKKKNIFRKTRKWIWKKGGIFTAH